ncbi:Ulp1 family isopeptidase [Xanthomonas hortorum]|uniref:Ulp1 family isopeptidase n=1 Tax=Xanthomonas hortorum TaxID=56454 RepID=UPI003D818ACC
MHPLLESLPRRNPTQVHADSSVHQMRAAAATSKTHRDYSKVLELIGAYGDGEDIAELRGRFSSFCHFLKDSGLSHINGKQMLQELNEDQRDQVIHQIIRRIGHFPDLEYREMALNQLESDCSQNIVLSQLNLNRIAKVKAEAKAKAKAKAKAEAEAEAEGAESAISKIMGYLPRYEALGKVPPTVGFHHYLRNDGSFGPALINILPHITPDQKKRFDLASERRKLALAAPKSKPLKGVFRTLHQNPDLLLEISSKFSNRACSINDARKGHLSQAQLEKIVDEKTGELTRLGEAVISGASEGIQAAIRTNFRIRYQQPDLPSTPPPRAFHPQEENLPPQSFFSGVSADWRRMGYQSAPDTPQYPPQSPASTFDGLSSMSHYGREFDLNTPQEIEQPWSPPRAFHPQEENLPSQSFFSGVSADWRPMGYQPDPDTPQYPAQSPASTFDGLSSMSHYGREFDLNTPQEEEEPGNYDTHTPMGYSAMSPERIDVDNLPEPQDVPDPKLPQVTATSWLLDGHLRAYTDELARRLRGQPNAHLLHFGDSQVVTMLSSADPEQQARARRLLAGDNVPPIVFLPINQPNVHWSLLVVDRRDSDAVATYHYDSMAQKQPQQRYLADMAAYHLGLDYEQTHEMRTAIQPDGYSCGDHVLTGIEMLAHRVIDGTFDYAGGRDLSDIEPDRGLIRDRLAQAAQAPAESSVRSVPERPIEQKKKKSKWWKF